MVQLPASLLWFAHLGAAQVRYTRPPTAPTCAPTGRRLGSHGLAPCCAPPAAGLCPGVRTSGVAGVYCPTGGQPAMLQRPGPSGRAGDDASRLRCNEGHGRCLPG